MLTLVRSQTKDKKVRQSLESLLGQVSSDVWLGEVTVIIFMDIEDMLRLDSTSNSYICKLGRTINVSNFYCVSNGQKEKVMFFEIYKNKSLLKNNE
jgi:hypothetical protein